MEKQDSLKLIKAKRDEEYQKGYSLVISNAKEISLPELENMHEVCNELAQKLVGQEVSNDFLSGMIDCARELWNETN